MPIERKELDKRIEANPLLRRNPLFKKHFTEVVLNHAVNLHPENPHEEESKMAVEKALGNLKGIPLKNARKMLEDFWGRRFEDTPLKEEKKVGKLPEKIELGDLGKELDLGELGGLLGLTSGPEKITVETQLSGALRSPLSY